MTAASQPSSFPCHSIFNSIVFAVCSCAIASVSHRQFSTCIARYASGTGGSDDLPVLFRSPDLSPDAPALHVPQDEFRTPSATASSSGSLEVIATASRRRTRPFESEEQDKEEDEAILILDNLTNAYDTKSASIMAGGTPWAMKFRKDSLKWIIKHR